LTDVIANKNVKASPDTFDVGIIGGGLAGLEIGNRSPVIGNLMERVYPHDIGQCVFGRFGIAGSKNGLQLWYHIGIHWPEGGAYPIHSYYKPV